MGDSSGGEVVRREMTSTRVPPSLAQGEPLHSLNYPDLVPGIGEENEQKKPGCLKLEVTVKLRSWG